MLIKSAIATEMTGPLAGLDAFRSSSGTAFRRMPSRSTSQSFRAVRQRGFYSELCGVWQSLSGDQRDSWNLYARMVARPGRLGKPIKLTGFSHFMRSNIPRRLFLPRTYTVLDAPQIWNVGAAPRLYSLVAVRIGGDNISLTWWQYLQDAPAAPVARDRILVYVGGPQSASRRWIAGSPKRRTIKTLGNPAAQPQHLSATESTFYWPTTLYQLCTLGIRITRADGRLSRMATATVVVP